MRGNVARFRLAVLVGLSLTVGGLRWYYSLGVERTTTDSILADITAIPVLRRPPLRIASAGDTGVDFGVINPTHFCQTNPRFDHQLLHRRRSKRGWRRARTHGTVRSRTGFEPVTFGL